MHSVTARYASVRGLRVVGLLCACVLGSLPPTPSCADPSVGTNTADAAAIDMSRLVPDDSGAIIGSITIANGSIFDLDNPAENKALYRLANRLHITTQPHVIAQQLLFAPGDRFSPEVIEESERILRSNRYIQDASIDPVQRDDGVVDIEVKTTDVWTLAPKLQFSRSGGTNSSGFGVRETNLLGRGIEVEAMVKSTVDRDSVVLKFDDQNVRDSWYGIATALDVSSDGHAYFLDFGKPFYSLNSTDSNAVRYFDSDRVDSLYDHGELAAQYRHRTRNDEIFVGWSRGRRQNWVTRYTAGLAYEQHRFDAAGPDYLATPLLPEDRQFLYPFVGIELVQDHYEKIENLDQIHRTEDRFLGTSLSARFGLAAAGMGSDRSAMLTTIGARTSFGDPERSVLFLSSGLNARLETGGWRNLVLDMDARYYRRQSEKRLFFAGISGSLGQALDLDQQLELGGDTGLRGYPLRYQAGEQRILLTLEQRVFTDWYPWRLFRIGAAVFFDAGRVWGPNALGVPNDGLLRDVGVGLRIGNPRSGIAKMAHVDLAVPLDGTDAIKNVQLLVSVKKTF